MPDVKEDPTGDELVPDWSDIPEDNSEPTDAGDDDDG